MLALIIILVLVALAIILVASCHAFPGVGSYFSPRPWFPHGGPNWGGFGRGPVGPRPPFGGGGRGGFGGGGRGGFGGGGRGGRGR